MNEKINLRQLAERLPEEFFGPDTDNRVALVNELFSIVCEMMAEDEEALLPGFGVFEPTGNSTDPVAFKADKAFADIVNAPFASFGPVDLDPEVTDHMLDSVAEPKIPVETESEDLQHAEMQASDINQDPVGTEIASEPPIAQETPAAQVIDEATDIDDIPAKEETNDIALEEDTVDSGRGGDIPISSPQEASIYPQPEKEEMSSRFGIGFFWGLLTGLIVGAIIFLVYVILTTDISGASTMESDIIEDIPEVEISE